MKNNYYKEFNDVLSPIFADLIIDGNADKILKQIDKYGWLTNLFVDTLEI